MATATEVRDWARKDGREVKNRGFLPQALIMAHDAANPDDKYEAGPPRGESNGHAPDYPDDGFEDQFPDVGGEGDGLAETPPKPIRSSKKSSSKGIGGLFGRSSKKSSSKRKPPRVSTENLLGAVWRGGAKLLTPLPPLQRTLRMQAPVAGMLLDDVVKDTVIDPLLQPLARIAQSGRTVQALIGPPAFVTAIMAHQAQMDAQQKPPNPLVMAIAVEGLRSSLMAWCEIAGPKFDIAMQREREFEEKYGQSVDDMIGLIFSAPVDPNDGEAVMAEEDAIRRAQGVL